MIRLVEEQEISKLADVERSASKKFSEFFRNNPDLTPAYEGDWGERTLKHTLLVEAFENKSLWVFIKDAEPVGFLAATLVDDMLHIQELSVMFEHQEKGVGRGLMNIAIENAKDRGYEAINLTTDRAIPWNLSLIHI